VEFVFSVLSVVCYLGLLLGVSNVVGAHGPHDIRQKSHQTYHYVTIAYSIQYNNMLYRFVA